MPRLLRLPVSTADHDISHAQTVDSSDGRPAGPRRSRAQIAFDETHIGDSTRGQVPKDSLVELSSADTHVPEDSPAPAPRLVGVDEQRMKALIKGKLFRGKEQPVKLGRFTVLDRLGEGGMG